MQLIIDSIETYNIWSSTISLLMGIQYHSFIYLLIHQEFIESLATEEASGLGSPFKAESI